MAQRLNVRRLTLFSVLAAFLIASVLLTSQPVQARLSDPTIKFQNGYIILKFEHTGSAVYRRAYIDADFYALGYHANVIYADYLLEDNQLYQFVGSSPTDWAWTPIATVEYSVVDTRVKWKIDQALIKRTCPYGLRAAFEVKKPRKIKTMPSVYRIDHTCALPSSTPTNTYTPSLTPILTYTLSPTATQTPTSTLEKWAAITNTPTATPSPSSPTDIPTAGPSSTPSNTPTPTATGPTATPSNTATPTPKEPVTLTRTPVPITPTQCGGGECPPP